ncbi:beta-ketoacyl-ACP synthase II [bacterium]|nr:beta-ketoacyl-ACP synthase II [bacterium]
MERVFVTGIGVVSPVGNNQQDFWSALVQGRSGIRRLEGIDLTDLPVTIGGEVRDIRPEDAQTNDKVAIKRMDRSSLFAVLAAKEALADAQIDPQELGSRCATILGSGLSGLATMEEQAQQINRRGPRGVSVFTIPMIMPNGPPANVSLAFNVMGPCFTTASACASSGHSTIAAFEAVRRGQVDAVLTGGTESPIVRLAIASFANMKALTKKFNDDPTVASRPFDGDRDGFVLAEGASVLILESATHARARKAKVYAEMIGYGDSADSYHLVQPDSDASGASRAIEQAFKMAGLSPAEVASRLYVNAHGTSTKLNDAAETLALKRVFGPAAPKLQISSTKSMTGHLIGAAGAIESAASVLALQNQLLPPTINYKTPDPECDLDYVPNIARPATIDWALNNSFGFGGHNTAILFAKAGSR